MAAIQVTAPLARAMQLTGNCLFKPLAKRKWLGIAFAFWLAMLGHGIGAEYIQPATWVGDFIGWDKIGDWITRHLVAFDVIAFALALVACVFYVFYRWLNALGQLALISQVAGNHGRVREPLGQHRAAAWKLGWFMIKWEFVVGNAFAVMWLSCAALAIPDIVHSWNNVNTHLGEILAAPQDFFRYYHITGWSISALIAVLASIFPFLLLLAPLSMFLNDFTIPILYHTGMKPAQAFAYTFTHIVFPNPRACFLYGLLMIVTDLAIGMASGIAYYVMLLVTLGIGFVLYQVPVLSNLPLYVEILIILPLPVFARIFSLTFLEQFEPRFRIQWQVSRPTGFEVILDAPQPPQSPPATP